jgi:hypothetical protein
MKPKLALLTAVGMAALVSACGDDHNTPPMMPATPTSTAQALDTAQVLALAKESSETTSPFAVDEGALTLTDTSETTEPISLNTM